MDKSSIRHFVRKSGLNINKYDVYAFGPKEENDALLDLVLKGTKRATTSLKLLYVKDRIKLPERGDYAVILNSKEEPVCIIKDINVFLCEFKDISDVYALTEGEGDKSLAYWKEEHKKVFSEDCKKELNREFSEDMTCVCEVFDLVYVAKK